MATYSSEAVFVRRLANCLRASGWHVQRIEDKYSVGIPDLNMCHPEVGEVWMEAKIFSWPKRSTTKVRIVFKDHQKPWHRARTRAGGEVFVIARENTTDTVLLFRWCDLIDEFDDPFDGTREEIEERAFYKGSMNDMMTKLKRSE